MLIYFLLEDILEEFLYPNYFVPLSFLSLYFATVLAKISNAPIKVPTYLIKIADTVIVSISPVFIHNGIMHCTIIIPTITPASDNDFTIPKSFAKNSVKQQLNSNITKITFKYELTLESEIIILSHTILFSAKKINEIPYINKNIL